MGTYKSFKFYYHINRGYAGKLRAAYLAVLDVIRVRRTKRWMKKLGYYK